MLNDSVQNKMPALITVVQHGIDQAHIVMDGWETWMGDGHDPGHRIIGAFAATMLDMAAAKTKLAAATNFHEDHYTDATALWGEGSTEDHYWTYVRGLGSGRSNRDPYGFIDGGTCGMDYQLIVSQSWKGSVLVASLMPSIQSAWNPTKWSALRRYVDRWVNTGVWSQPDPCAPYTAYGVYGVNYGPDPRNPGMCILDPNLKYYNTRNDFQCRAGVQCGRYPTKHGTEKDGGMYRSDFVAAMWNVYYRYEQETQQMRPSSPKGLRVIQP